MGFYEVNSKFFTFPTSGTGKHTYIGLFNNTFFTSLNCNVRYSHTIDR